MRPSRAAARVAACLALAGCAERTVPDPKRQIDALEIEGADAVDASDVEEHIATRATSRFLGGVLEGVPVLGGIDALSVEYRTFDRVVLERDLVRIERYYRSRGYYDAKVRAGRVVRLEGGELRVEIAVDEGPLVTVAEVALEGDDALEEPLRERLREAVEPLVGEAFDEQGYDERKRELASLLGEAGYAHAAVEGHARVEVAAQRAALRFVVRPGPACTFGDVTFEVVKATEEGGLEVEAGLGELPEDSVRDVVGIEPGEPYTTADLHDAESALADLGVFGSIEVVPQLGDGTTTTIPVLVRVGLAELRAVKIGGGAEIGTRLEAHLAVGWEDRNLLGGLRRLSIEARPGLVFFPVSAANVFETPPATVLPEVRLDVAFKQPAFPEARTNTLLSSGTRIYAAPVGIPPDPLPDDYNIVGYHELHAMTGVERLFRFPTLGRTTLYLAQLLRLELDSPFSYNRSELPDGYSRVLIPYLQTAVGWDMRMGADGRPDGVHPRSGFYMGNDIQIAALGDATDIRYRPDFRGYVPLGSGAVLAMRFMLGLLFPFTYAKDLMVDPEATPDADTRSRDLQLLSFRGLWSGGPNGNRGYGLREVSPHDVLPFVSPSGASDELAPSGGTALWEASVELRGELTEKLWGVFFVDASDVTRRIVGMRLDHPHLSPGLGLRYETPVGPIRFDLGVRVPYLQHVGEPALEPEEGGPSDGSDEVPLELSIAFGEAY